MKIKISKYNITSMFIPIFNAIPSYFQFVGVAIVNIVCLVQIAANIRISRESKIRGNSFTMFLGAWLLWLFLMSFYHSDIMSAVVMGLYVLACVSITCVIKTEGEFYKAVDAVIYTGGVVGIFGIIESFSGFNVFSLLNTSGMALNYNPPRFGLTRIISSSGGAIEYCLYCMFILFLTFYRCINMNKNKQKKKILTIYCIIFINAVLTLSRSSLLCLIVGQMLLLYYSGLRTFFKTAFKIIIAAIIAGIVLSACFPTIANMIRQLFYMFLAIFNDDYESMISLSFGNDNLSAYGNRLDLYSWVIGDMKGHYLLGMGAGNRFQHAFTQKSGVYEYTVIKESIEVDYLSTLWRTGVIGMLLKILTCLSLLVKTFRSKRKRCANEMRLSYGRLCHVCVLCYMVAWFAVAQGTEFKAFITIIALYGVYIKLGRLQSSV